jgi:predicted ATPase
MSVYGVSALERGYRKTPQFETLSLLAGALALGEEQRREFVAAAQLGAVRNRGSVTVGPWPSPRTAKLPLALTRFIGREAELGEIATLVREHRLVTVTGAGGVGKTQTALQTAVAMSESPDREVRFVGLAPIGDPALVVAAIAGALGVREAPNHTLLETVLAYLENKTLLLVLDNCEHVIQEAAVAVDALLLGCPRVRILATSREPLRAAGERTYRLPSLNAIEASVLFADRAQAVVVHFDLNDENASIVSELCRRLDGIPLAIELAAARANVLSLEALAGKLNDRFAVLSIGNRTALPRQQTMRATIDWSYELLTPPEQRVFERLSIFANGCTLDDATAVCADSDVAANDVFALISSLVDKSLVAADLDGIEPRYRLLESFRQYARHKLRERREAEVIAQRHLAAYLDLCARFELRDQHYSIYQGCAVDEIGNWRAAVQWALTEGNDVLGGQRLIAQVVHLWGGTASVFSDARRWVPAALDLADAQTPQNVIARLVLAETRVAQCLENHTEQLASAEKAIAYYRDANDELGLVRAQTEAGNALYKLGRVEESRAILEVALSTARRRDYPWDIRWILRNLSGCLNPSDLVASRAFLTEAIDLIKAAGDVFEMEVATLDLAEVAFSEGDPEAAVRHIAALFADGRQMYCSRRVVVAAQDAISKYLIAVGRYEEAREYAGKALDASCAEHLEVYAAKALGRLATIAALKVTSQAPDARANAARILGFVEARLKALGSAVVDEFDGALTALRGTMGAEAFASLTADGARMTEDEAVEAATAL